LPGAAVRFGKSRTTGLRSVRPVAGDEPAGQGNPDEHPYAFILDDGAEDAPPRKDEPDHHAQGLRIASAWLKARRLREDMFGPGLFSDPAWDILLDLYTAEAKGKHVQITSLAVAARVPHSTAIRWAGIMTRAGLLVRQKDPGDARRIHISLSLSARELMRDYFEKLSRDGLAPVLILTRHSP
jgi:DNA-binding MarR family transcriptional regulator